MYDLPKDNYEFSERFVNVVKKIDDLGILINLDRDMQDITQENVDSIYKNININNIDWIYDWIDKVYTFLMSCLDDPENEYSGITINELYMLKSYLDK